jgi:hypothetical protein
MIRTGILWVSWLVWSLGGTIGSNVSEKLTAEGNGTTAFSFAVMGDSRDGNSILVRIIQSINQDNAIRFSVNNGDLVSHGRDSEFAEYEQMVAKAVKPMVHIIGNHDMPGSSKRNYRKWIGEPYFSFVYGNSYFIIADNANMRGFDSRQQRWLVNELETSRNYVHCFVFMHVPLYDPRKGNYAKGHSLRDLNSAYRINALLDHYHVTMLFASHIHAYFRGQWHQTPFIITGGAGAPLKSGGYYHYVKVTVDGKHVKYSTVKVHP